MRRAGLVRRAAPHAADAVLRLDYDLAELPSAQHRAGLAGLVLMVQWLDRLPGKKPGTCRLSRLDETGTSLEVDQAGLWRLFDEVYAATEEEQPVSKPRKDPRRKLVPPLRTAEQTITDARGKSHTRTVYYYPIVVPRGAFLLAWDPGRNGMSGPWVKLWRDALWSIFRGVPRTRAPYEMRAAGERPRDADTVWTELSSGGNQAVELPSTYYLGAQAVSAENVPFRDRARFRFLLHFWPFVAQIYVPEVVDPHEGKRRFVGYAIAVPDVGRLATFCEELPEVLKQRGVERMAFRPREAIIDLVVESALDIARRLADQVKHREGEHATMDLVLGFETFHAEKRGNNVVLLGSQRVDPDPDTLTAYGRLRGEFWDPFFRRMRLLNLVKDRPWYAGFDQLAATLPHRTQTIGSKAFRHDARRAFELETTREVDMAGDRTTQEVRETPELVHQLIGAYVNRRVKARTGMDWGAVKDDPQRKQRYQEEKESVARNAFLAVRSRTGADFVDYFTGTICSVPQYLRQAEFAALARTLRDDPASIRTLTLLALSAWS